jgi:methylenetetrahydrofolate dehydrogenase (NADP+)/methenyltetrahydrofolate cyclohydrolase
MPEAEAMAAEIIDGKAFAAGLRARIAERVAEIGGGQGVTPGLAVVLVGDDPASAVYGRNKGRATVRLGCAPRSTGSTQRRPRRSSWR